MHMSNGSKGNTDKVKIGLVGNGSICSAHCAGYDRERERAEIYAVCDINTERARALAARYNIPSARVFDNVHDMVKLQELDAVDVCTWNNAHAECAIAALRAGKHVLCEKPMAMNAAQAQEMQKAAKEAGKLLMIGFVRRYGNDCDVLQDLVRADYFGDIYYAKTTYLRRNGSPGGWFSDKARSGGGPLIDLGVHVIDLARYVMGNPKPVSVYGATFDRLKNRPGIRRTVDYASQDASAADIFNVEDFATALIRFDNGSVLSVEASFSLNLKNDMGDIEFFGTRAGARLSPELELFSETNGFMSNTQLVYPTALSFNGLFEKEIHHFLDCILKGEPCRSPAEDGVTIMRILDGIYASAASGHEVLLTDPA